jgi:hypothetical protein
MSGVEVNVDATVFTLGKVTTHAQSTEEQVGSVKW